MTSLKRSDYRALIKDCFEPDLGIFWREFLIAYAAFLGGLAALFFAPSLSLQVAGFFLAALMAYRCAIYMHEVVHLPRVKFRSFIYGWNILVGIPFLLPSILYEPHLEHHLPKQYATDNDPEYAPLAGSSALGIIWFILHHAFVTPVILYIRMLIGLPVRLLSAKGTDYLERRLSSLVINWHYDRRNRANKKLLIGMEAYVLAVTVIFSILIYQGVLAPLVLVKLVGVIMVGLIFNAIRTLAAHRYINLDLAPMTVDEQLLDSLNYVGPKWIGLIVAPVGLRFHALHHLFPSIPYHALETAHDRLMAATDEDDIYRRTNFSSYFKQMWDLTKKPDIQAKAANPDTSGQEKETRSGQGSVAGAS
ncbi:fatty acid desaturase family protein [Eilatimonas milleporae]|uniref:Fatty acid desaturase n=1 Tax=Eilatimonas milleporae TaxID=911205 RepID=A0A3M0C2R4_9PROT|nr:fatty acid desaturase [Eilatimonas milleporae]RMB02660.1 fatty acid desaturase [Eilatimonas milleporae]